MDSHNTLIATGDSELDALAQQKLREELARLERNQERRLHRERLKAKNLANASAAGSPAAAASPGPGPSSPSISEASGPAPTPAAPNASKPGKGRSKDGTARKCANCGQVGHIKTNRKSVPTPKFVCTCEVPDFGPEEEKKKRAPRPSRKRKAAGGPDTSDLSGVVRTARAKPTPRVPAGGAFTMGSLNL